MYKWFIIFLNGINCVELQMDFDCWFEGNIFQG